MIEPGSHVRSRGTIVVLALGTIEQELTFGRARVARIEGDRAVVHLVGTVEGRPVEARRPFHARLVDLLPTA
jgi:hypothetical protein